MIVRPATAADIPGMIDQSQALQDSGYGAGMYPAIDRAAAEVAVAELLRTGFAAVAEIEGRIVGSIGLQAQQYFWNPNVWLLANVWFHVDPDHRAGGTAAKLLRLAKDFADAVKAPLLLEIGSVQAPHLKDRFARMQGFQYVGGRLLYGTMT